MKINNYLCSLILILLQMISLRAYCQSYNQNYIATETILNDNGTLSVKSVQYYDGLGRPSVLVVGGINTSGKYNYSATEYDMLGRKSKIWQPAVGTTSPDIINIATMASMSKSTYNNDSLAFSEIKYDDFGNQTFKGTSGNLWNGKGIKKEYITNDVKSVRRYELYSSGLPKTNSMYYDACTLTGVRTTDEDGHTIEVYKDVLGNVVLERRDGNNDTYYVYEHGLLRTVIPPLYQEKKESSLLYRYKYDGHGRCIEKILPGCQPIKYWYDKYGRMAFMQDNRMKSAKKYRFYLYDGLSRLVVQGTCTGGAGTIDSTYAAKVFYGAGGKQVDNSNYFVDAMYQLDNPTLEIVNYYDSYDCVDTEAFSSAKSTWNLKNGNGVCTNTLQTAQMLTDNNGKRYFRVMYYDEKGRCTEMNSTSIDGYFIKINTSYSFTDKPTKTITRTYKGSPNSLQHTLIDFILYNDVCDLPEKEYIKLDNNPEECIADNVYDDLGRLVESRSNNGNIRDLYEYDLHGWLTSHKNYDDRIYHMPMFKEKLYYADGPNSKPCYNGNISAQVYSDADNYYDDKGYLFDYDGLDRMKSAKYKAGSELNKNPRIDYSAEVTYNANSSVLTMKIKGNENRYGFVDNLNFTYSGNRLFKVSDSAFDVSLGESAGFVDGYEFGVKSGQPGYRSDYDQEYSYDGCGSLTSDKNKGVLNIKYDFNGMPVRVLFGNGNITEYVYTADGVKLKTIHRTAVDGIVTYSNNFELTERETLSKDSTVYVGLFEINSCKDNMYHFGNGYIDIEQGHVKAYCYYAKDHLGNVRHIDMANPNTNRNEIVQVNNYYPFGGVMDEGSRRGANVQNHLYNGKEFDRMHGLNFYDYSARQYDPAICQFTSMDPLCEKYYHISPYAYCAGNPVKYVDPSGEYICTFDTYVDANGMLNSKEYIFSVSNNYVGDWFDKETGEQYHGNNYFMLEMRNALNTLLSKPHGRALVMEAINHPDGILLQEGNRTGFTPYSDYRDPGIKVAITINLSDTPPDGGTLYTTLAHELRHALDYLNHVEGADDYWCSVMTPKGERRLTKSEINALHTENLVRAEHGLPLRRVYEPGTNSTVVKHVNLPGKEYFTSVYYDRSGKVLPDYKKIGDWKNAWPYKIITGDSIYINDLNK